MGRASIVHRMRRRLELRPNYDQRGRLHGARVSVKILPLATWEGWRVTRRATHGAGPMSRQRDPWIGDPHILAARPSALSVVAPAHTTIREANLTHPLWIVDVPAIHQDRVPHQRIDSDHV